MRKHIDIRMREGNLSALTRFVGANSFSRIKFCFFFFFAVGGTKFYILVCFIGGQEFFSFETGEGAIFTITNRTKEMQYFTSNYPLCLR